MHFLESPIYFFTVLFNILAGFLLCSDYIKDKIPSFNGFLELINTKEARFIFGIGSFILGVFKFISPKGIIIIGDFIPALSSLLLGVTLLMDFFRENTTFTSDTMQKVDDMLLGHKDLIGVVGITIAVIHIFLCDVPVFL